MFLLLFCSYSLPMSLTFSCILFAFTPLKESFAYIKIMQSFHFLGDFFPPSFFQSLSLLLSPSFALPPSLYLLPPPGGQRCDSSQSVKESIRLPGAGVAGDCECEPPDLDARHWTPVFWKSSRCSCSTSHLSSLTSSLLLLPSLPMLDEFHLDPQLPP